MIIVCSPQPSGSLRREATPPGDKAPPGPRVSIESEATGKRVVDQRAGRHTHTHARTCARHSGAEGHGIKQFSPGLGVEAVPTCDPDIAAEISIRDLVGVRVARNFQGPASVVWKDEKGSLNCPLTSPAGH